MQAAYGSDLVLERVWFPNSTSLLQSVLDGDTHMSEPYYTVDSFFNARARKRSFDVRYCQLILRGTALQGCWCTTVHSCARNR